MAGRVGHGTLRSRTSYEVHLHDVDRFRDTQRPIPSVRFHERCHTSVGRERTRLLFDRSREGLNATPFERFEPRPGSVVSRFVLKADNRNVERTDTSIQAKVHEAMKTASICHRSNRARYQGRFLTVFRWHVVVLVIQTRKLLISVWARKAALRPEGLEIGVWWIV